jgi:hypothetical protein
MTKDIKNIKIQRLVAISFFVLCLCGLITYNAMRPSQEEKDVDNLRDKILSRRSGGEISEEQRQEMRKLFDRLSPESKDKLAREILEDRLNKMREKTAKMSDEEKILSVKKSVQEFRERFSKISDEERARIKERMNSAEGKEQFKRTLQFYSTEFTAKEREFLDPLVNEVLAGINSL